MSGSTQRSRRLEQDGRRDQERRRFGDRISAQRNRTDSIEERVAAIEADVGPIEVVVYNLGAQIGDRALADTSLKAFETGSRLGTFGLFRLAQAVCPPMAARGKGTILVTSSTAAMRGNGGQHSHAAAMGGRRLLCQTLNAQFAAKGIHVAHIVIDGAVDAPDTLGKMLGPERFQQLRETRGNEHDGLMLPAEVAGLICIWRNNTDRRGPLSSICAPSRTVRGGITEWDANVSTR